MKLFDLFPNLTTAWPGDRIRFETGDFVVGPDQAIIGARLAELNNIIDVLDPHFGAEGGVGMEARLRVDNSLSADLEPFLFALKAMPRVGFRLLNTDPIELPRLLVVQQDDGVEIVIEGLPVQIELPTGFVSPPRDEDDDGLSPFPPDVVRGTFLAGYLDTQKVTYREDDPTTIQVHIRVVIDKELDIIIVPAVPITFEACTFLEGIPVKGVYDFHLLPSPGKARQWLPWIRHSVSEWFEGVVGGYEGAFAARHVWLDPKAGWVGDVSKWLNEHSDKDPTAEFVIDDLVVPFMIPIPRHATIGIRRSLEDVADVADVIDFEQAPVVHYFRRSAPIGFLINELFLRSQSAENIFSDAIRFDLALFFGEEAEDSEDLGNPTWSAGIQLADEGTLLATLARDMDDIGDVPGLDWKFGGTGISIVRGSDGRFDRPAGSW